MATGVKRILVLLGVDDRRSLILHRNIDGSVRIGLNGNVPLRPPFHEFGEVNDLFLGVDVGNELTVTRPDLVVNLICNGDTNQRSLTEAVELTQALGKPVVNPPALVRRTGRQAMAELAATIHGVMAPPVITITPGRLRDIEAPYRQGRIPRDFIMRPLAQHGGQSLVRVRQEADLAQLEQYAFDGQVFGISPFIDYRSREGLYRKYRLVFIDGVAYPRHLIINDQWMIHSKSRLALMKNRRDLQAEEERYLDNPREVLGEMAWNGLHELAHRTELDFVGVDFSLLPDGRALLFECNACMNVLGQGAGGSFAYLDPVVQRIETAIMDLVQRRLD